jgi:hypothetical protein
MNSHWSPRKDNAREYLKFLQRRDAEWEKAVYVDNGPDTLIDGCTEEFESMCREPRAHCDVSPECHFGTLVD